MAVMNSYETVMVLSTKLGDEGIQAMIEKFKALIEKHATIENVDEWGKRRLAYLINDEADGYYVLINFKSTADFPAELDRRYKITDGILRSLIVRKEDVKEDTKKDVKEDTKKDAKEDVKEDVKEDAEKETQVNE